VTEIPAGALAAGEWIVTAIGAALVGDASPPTLTFTREGHVAGTTGINRFSGAYALEGVVLTIGPVLMTRMAGPEHLMEQERLFTAALEGATAVLLEGDTLTLGGETPLTLRAAGPEPA
jgi:heat shock protein HslJ